MTMRMSVRIESYAYYYLARLRVTAIRMGEISRQFVDSRNGTGIKAIPKNTFGT